MTRAREGAPPARLEHLQESSPKSAAIPEGAQSLLGQSAFSGRAAEKPRSAPGARAPTGAVRALGGGRNRAKVRAGASRLEQPNVDENLAILALVDALAVLAADLWFEGKLEGFDAGKEPHGDYDD
jgi:hypothetical protein